MPRPKSLTKKAIIEETRRLHSDVLGWSKTNEAIEQHAYDKSISDPYPIALGMCEDLLNDLGDRGYDISWMIYALALRLGGQSVKEEERARLREITSKCDFFDIGPKGDLT